MSVCFSVFYSSFPQPWVDEVRELGQNSDPLTAQLEAEAVDVRGGRGEGGHRLQAAQGALQGEHGVELL